MAASVTVGLLMYCPTPYSKDLELPTLLDELLRVRAHHFLDKIVVPCCIECFDLCIVLVCWTAMLGGSWTSGFGLITAATVVSVH